MKGGINALNRDLALGCGRLCKGKHRIVCCVIHASEHEIRAAAEANVKLISLSSEFGISDFDEESLPKLCEVLGKDENKSEFIIGHDIFTGQVAIAVASILGSRSVVFIHTDYGAYKAIQDGGYGSRAAEKVAGQVSIVQRADYVYGVGPTLHQLALNLDGSDRIKRRRRIRNFVPGLADITPKKIEGPMIAVSYGRYEGRNDLVKQPHLSIAAFCAFVKAEEARSNEDDSRPSEKRLLVAGYSLDEKERAEQIKRTLELAAQHYDGALNVSCREFLPRAEALEVLRNSNLSMMLSWREGFGLVGWEAIAAGVPLILSEQSGLCEFLDQKFDHLGSCYWPVRVRGTYDNQVNPADVQDVSEALRRIDRKKGRAAHLARMLRLFVLEEYSWHRRARAFLRSLDKHGFRVGRSERSVRKKRDRQA